MENKHFKLSENECKTVKAINEFTNKIIEVQWIELIYYFKIGKFI